MNIPPETEQWLNWVLLTSTPLRKSSNNTEPTGFASGTLIDYKGRRFLLTVSHAVGKNSTDWVMEIDHDSLNGAIVHKRMSFFHLGEMTLGSGERKVGECTCAEIPTDVQPFFQLRNSRGSASEKLARHIFTEQSIMEPNVDSIYAFSGQVLPEWHDGVSALCTTHSVYPGLKFISSEDQFHLFKLPVEHPGHEEFKGCSGAPIVDKERKVVAVVSKGCKKSGMVYGVSISRYKFLLESYCSYIKPN